MCKIDSRLLYECGGFVLSELIDLSDVLGSQENRAESADVPVETSSPHPPEFPSLMLCVISCAFVGTDALILSPQLARWPLLLTRILWVLTMSNAMCPAPKLPIEQFHCPETQFPLVTPAP